MRGVKSQKSKHFERGQKPKKPKNPTAPGKPWGEPKGGGPNGPRVALGGARARGNAGDELFFGFDRPRTNFYFFWFLTPLKMFTFLVYASKSCSNQFKK